MRTTAFRLVLTVTSAFLLFASLAIAYAPSSAAAASILEGRVVSVADGDTITVLDSSNSQHKIRLAGIDAPEKAQAFGNRSKQRLSELVFGKHVVVEYTKADRYGRLVGKVRVEGRDANLEQLKAGLAWMYREYERELSVEDRRAYDQAETTARAAKRGLWSDPKPKPPWEVRHPETAKDLPAAAGAAPGSVVGNKRSGIYHLPNCPDYAKISPANRELFSTAEAAERAGYRKARNCP